MMSFRRNFLPDWRMSRLQRRFALASVIVLTVVSLIFLGVLTRVYRTQILAEHTRSSVQVSELLQATLENAMIKRDLDGLRAILDDLARQDGIHKVSILNPDGEVRFGSDPDDIGRVVDDPGFEQALRAQTPVSAFLRGGDDADVVRIITPVPNQPRCTGCHGAVAQSPVNGVLMLDYDAGGVRMAMWRGMALLGALGVLVMLAVQAGLWVSVRRLVLNPANDLDQVAQVLAQGDLSARAVGGGDDELARLGESVNTMAARIQQSMTALTQEREFLQSLVDAIPDGIRVIGPDYRTLIVNRAFREQLGLGDAGVVGQPCYALSHHRNGPCVPTMTKCPLVELQGDETSVKCTHVHKTSSGSEMQVEVFSMRTMMQVDGVATPCIVESIRDLNSQMSISQEQRLAEMGLLAAGVAHEVYNPLSSLCLILDTLAEQDLDAQGRDYLALARTEIENCRTVTESMLRIAAPGMTGNAPTPADMAQILIDTAGLLRFEADQRGVTFDITAPPDTVVVGIESDLRMLVFNLTQNAVHAMPDGGRISLACVPEGGGVLLTVRDQGVGIAPQDLEKITMPFWTRRADGSSGRGLGLSICHSVVSRAGGHMDVQSTLGEGSLFSVFLPRDPSQPKERPATAHA